MKFLILFVFIFMMNQVFACDEFSLCDQAGCKIRIGVCKDLDALDQAFHHVLRGKSVFSLRDVLAQYHKIEDFKSPDWKLIELDSKWSMLQELPAQQNLLRFWIQKERDKYSDVPSKFKENEYGLSCGPISIAMAYELMGYSKDWPKFIKSFPYFHGGVLPQHLVDYLDRSRLIQEPSLTHMKADHFDVVLETLRREVDQNRPFMVLLVPGALFQHYVNIIGYDDQNQRVLILDPSARLEVASYEWLKQVMYAGVRSDLGRPYFLGSLFSVPYMMGRTSVGYYNAFVFNPSQSAQLSSQVKEDTVTVDQELSLVEVRGKREYRTGEERRHLYIDPEGTWYTTIHFVYPEKRDILFFSGDEQVMVEHLLRGSQPRKGPVYRCGFFECCHLLFENGKSISVYSQDVDYLLEQFQVKKSD